LRTKPQTHRAPFYQRTWFIPVTALAAFLLGLLSGYFGRPLVSPGPAGIDVVAPGTPGVDPGPGGNQEVMSYLIQETRHFKGDASAPVVIIEFSDFKSPDCSTFSAGAGRQIRETYIAQGQVRLGYWHYVSLGPESQTAAEASECAADQGAFWEYHDLIFALGAQGVPINIDSLKLIASEMGLDRGTFDACLDRGKYTDLVQQQTALAQQLGIANTPAFMINAQAMLGVQPFESFQQVIETQLAR